MPVSDAVRDDLRAHPERRGDTTGCGDNFVGGMLHSLALQSTSRARGELNLPQAVAVAICAGGAACFQVGGTYVENKPVEKLNQIARYHE